MYSVTTFEWKGGLKNLAVTSFGARTEEPALWIDEIRVRIQDGYGTIKIQFRTASPTYGKEEYEFVEKMFSGFTYGANGLSFSLSVSAKDGEPTTVTVTKSLLRILRACGIHTVSAPRIVEERFIGSSRNAYPTAPVSYGEHLFSKLIAGEIPEA